jgi:ribosome maturation protein Sdo1
MNVGPCRRRCIMSVLRTSLSIAGAKIQVSVRIWTGSRDQLDERVGKVGSVGVPAWQSNLAWRAA